MIKLDNKKCIICEKYNKGVDIVYQDSSVSISHMVRHTDKSDNY
ncbi:MULTISPECIES: hypothetical protein [unclassified Sedimentibacter]|nr:hypothetical protein [Sedimentibacter sp. MB35-C1]WMJ76178.1 hypothetical protein RBQ61_11130 [Sedimentibacter sp. MB35-C1]